MALGQATHAPTHSRKVYSQAKQNMYQRVRNAIALRAALITGFLVVIAPPPPPTQPTHSLAASKIPSSEWDTGRLIVFGGHDIKKTFISARAIVEPPKLNIQTPGPNPRGPAPTPQMGDTHTTGGGKQALQMMCGI